MRKLICVFLVLCLVGAAPMQALADETASTNESIVVIYSPEDLLRFANNCVLDSYSTGMKVYLKKDIDLTSVEFEGIPIFSGTFYGGHHRISGLNITKNGSRLGLFRILTESANVKDLYVEGTVAPGGSASFVGGIAGSNAGTIENCSFSGQISGIDYVGGIAGSNLLTGVAASCRAYGKIHGNHFVGGIAGQSAGVIRNSENHAQVNATAEQNDISLEDITLESITSSEFAAAITDIGGITGAGTGVIRGCTNYATVGYRQIGYNIGGIAGSHSGYITDCLNRGQIYGRKEVGGIAGQLEPAAKIEYAQDTLQTLQGQMNDMSSLTGAAGAHAQGGTNALNAQAQRLEQQVKDAQDALDILIPDPDDTELPDADAILAAQNTLSSSLSGITDSMNSMVSIGESTLSALSQDIKAIAGQMSAIGGTIGSAAENLGGSITDVSDLDTSMDITAKIEKCANHGSILGDLNIGGIIGSVAFENDLDPESDLNVLGESSLNFAMELRAVVLNCRNYGQIQCNKQNAGGIAGWMSLGLIRQCVNTADLLNPNTDYSGGIVGQSLGTVRNCSVKCTLSGDTYVGGIAGIASTVTDCRALLQLQSTSEYSGAILGYMEDAQLQGNYYLPVGSDPGAVDGISYAGLAQALNADSFFTLEDLPFLFEYLTIQFVFDDGTSQAVSVLYGTPLSDSMFPQVPQAEGVESRWTGPIAAGDPIYVNAAFTLAHTGHITTVESDAHNASGRPVFLAQGEFIENNPFPAVQTSFPESMEAWELTLPESAAPITLRYRIPQGCSPENLILTVRSQDGTQQQLPFSVDGSYLVFEAPDSLSAVSLQQAPKESPLPLLIGAAMGIAAAGILIGLLIRHSKKKKKK